MNAVVESVSKAKEDMRSNNQMLIKKMDSIENNESRLEKKCDVIKDSFEHWAKKVLGPSPINEARIFSMETRMKEGEDERIKEIAKVKDTIKKLIFALEQYNIQNMVLQHPHSDDESEPLPLLKGIKKVNNPDEVEQIAMKSDILFLKRMKFLKENFSKRVDMVEVQSNDENNDTFLTQPYKVPHPPQSKDMTAEKKKFRRFKDYVDSLNQSLTQNK